MKNIIFDFGGVLLDWNPDHFYLPYFNGNTNRMEDFYATTQIKTLNKELDRGMPFDTFLTNMIRKFPQYASELKLWKNAWHKMLGDKIEGSIEILHKLNANGYQLYGLTNWSADTFPYVYYTHDFFHIFKDIVVSGREHTIKPEAEIYQICLQRNRLEPSETIFIDDNLDNVAAAQALGIYGIHFTDAVELQKSLIDVGIKLM